MTKKIVVVAIIALGIILSLFLGCKDALIETLEKVQAYVEISVKLPEEFKTVDPADPNYFDPDTFTYILTWFPVNDPSNRTEEDFAYDENVAVVFKFDPGEYTFVLEGKVIDEDTNQEEIKARGEATTSIEPGQREQLEIPIKYIIYGTNSGLEVGKNGDIILSGTIEVPAGTTLVLSGNVKTEGNLIVQGDLEIDGKFTVSGDLSVSGDFDIDGDLAVGGNLEVVGKLDAQGATSMAQRGTL